MRGEDSGKSILIIDDHLAFCRGLESIINEYSDYCVVGSAFSYEEGLKQFMESSPLVTIVDLFLDGQLGSHLVEQLIKVDRDTKAITISLYTDLEYVIESFRAGALGYLLKDSSVNKLIAAIDTVVKGEYFIDNTVSQLLVHKVWELPRDIEIVHDDFYEVLTEREFEVLRLYIRDIPIKKIAVILEISEKTVESHRFNIMEKLGARTKIELIRFAARMGIIDIQNKKNENFLPLGNSLEKDAASL